MIKGTHYFDLPRFLFNWSESLGNRPRNYSSSPSEGFILTRSQTDLAKALSSLKVFGKRAFMVKRKRQHTFGGIFSKIKSFSFFKLSAMQRKSR